MILVYVCLFCVVLFKRNEEFDGNGHIFKRFCISLYNYISYSKLPVVLLWHITKKECKVNVFPHSKVVDSIGLTNILADVFSLPLLYLSVYTQKNSNSCEKEIIMLHRRNLCLRQSKLDSKGSWNSGHIDCAG